MRGLQVVLLLLVQFQLANSQVEQQTMIPVSHRVGDVPVNSTDRVTYQCTFRNLWTKERQPINYPEEDAQWWGPILWTHKEEFQAWQAGQAATFGLQEAVEVGVIQ